MIYRWEKRAGFGPRKGYVELASRNHTRIITVGI